MTEDVQIRTIGAVGHITLNRPKSLNALTLNMVISIDSALEQWKTDQNVHLVLIDSVGDAAFCAGGDVLEIYNAGVNGDDTYAKNYWRHEYSLNAKIYEYPKPYVAFLQGYTMGGGVGISCLGSHRIVCETSAVAMPECGIGLVPDVGGSMLLAQAPGALGTYLATTGSRMNAADAIHAGFADYYVPLECWSDLKDALFRSANWKMIADFAQPPGPAALPDFAADIDAHFSHPSFRDVAASLDASSDEFAVKTRQRHARNSPLSMACAFEMVRNLAGSNSIGTALAREFRFTSRAIKDGDFLEGIRSVVIEKDGAPNWKHADPASVSRAEIDHMLAPLGADRLQLEEQRV